MSFKQQPFSIGSKFQISGENYSVVSLNGSGVTARSARGKLEQFEFGTLFNTPGFTSNTETLPDVASEVSTEGVPEAALLKAKELAAHILEALTGHRSGSSDDSLLEEPKAAYDPESLSTSKRLANKAAELKMGKRALWLMKDNYEKFGLAGLVDKRALRQKGMKVDARVRQALIAVMGEFEEKSNPSRKQLKRLTENMVREKYPGDNVAIPSEPTFNRLVTELEKGTQLFASAKQRRSNANRPDKPYSHFHANRPGELIVIDSTPLDAFAMDPYSFKWVSVQLTVAIDIYSRSLMAWRFTPVSTKAVDAALLLYDILRAKPMRPTWKPTLKWAYAGVPENLLIEAGGDANHPLPLAALPFLHPESVLVDRGRVFLSETFMAACRTLGINLMVARPYTPTDKAHVERFFKTIRENFVANLAGYKGPDIHSRGKDIESDAFWFIDEIEENFAEWAAAWFQNREHAGLELPHVPALKLSPNNMLEEGIARAGFVYAPPNSDLYYELLPTAWRTIQHYGVEINVRYDGDILNDFRDRKSPYGGKYQGRWPFKYDPRDRSVVYFRDPETRGWHTLKWNGADRYLRPFSAKTLSYAKSLVITRHLDPSSHGDLTHVLNELLDRMDAQQLDGKKERRLAAQHVQETANAAKDRGLAPPGSTASGVLSTAPEMDEAEESDAIASGLFRHAQPEAKHIIEGAFRTTEEADEDEDDDLVI